MIKKILVGLIFLSWANFIFAADVKIAVEPTEPLINETFQVIFTIESSSSEEPYISFDPGKAEVLGRKKLGTSVQTTIINGRISSKRVTRYSYEMTTDRAGRFSLKNIKAEVDGDEYKLKSYSINVLRKRKTPKEFFVAAEPSKTSVFVGEGFDVNYYLYFRSSGIAKEILEYPKLKKLLKRFRQVSDKVETVRSNGIVYNRALVYSARAFSDREGKVSIDPIKVRVQFQRNRSNSFGFSGLSFGSYKTKTLRSKRVKVEVKALPAENVPSNFSGLVGDHEFKLNINRTKFLVNEAIEASLEVSGNGALENYEPPKIFENDNLEDFDTKAELTGLERGQPTKTFEYTLLARGPVTIPERELTISYFDPELEEYKSKSITIPQVIVGGSAQAGAVKQATKNEPEEVKNEKEEVVIPENVNGLLAPVFYRTSGHVRAKWPFYLNVVLLVIILFLSFSILMSLRGPKLDLSSYDDMLKVIKKNGMNYSNIYRLLNNLNGNAEDSLGNRIQNSKLSVDSKHYFENLLLMAEQSQYKDNSKLSMNFKNKQFKELVNYLKRTHNGSH